MGVFLRNLQARVMKDELIELTVLNEAKAKMENWTGSDDDLDLLIGLLVRALFKRMNYYKDAGAVNQRELDDLKGRFDKLKCNCDKELSANNKNAKELKDAKDEINNLVEKCKKVGSQLNTLELRIIALEKEKINSEWKKFAAGNVTFAASGWIFGPIGGAITGGMALTLGWAATCDGGSKWEKQIKRWEAIEGYVKNQGLTIEEAKGKLLKA